jgi:4-amino-4-deoxy-L-arabinose transferase-like glycosyltransferase
LTGSSKAAADTDLRIVYIKAAYLAFMLLMLVVYPWWVVVEQASLRFLFFILSFLLSFVLYFILGWVLENSRRSKGRAREGCRFSRKEIIVCLLFFIVLIALHGYAMTFPSDVFTSDESFHIGKGLFFFFAASVMISKIGALYSALFFCALVILCILAYRSRARIVSSFRAFMGRHSLLSRFRNHILFLLLLVVFIGYFVLLNHFVQVVHTAQFGSGPVEQSHFAWLVRFAPVGTIISSLFHVFGHNLFMIRLLQTILYFLSGVMLYKLVCLFRSRIVAFFAAAFLLLAPGYFEYGHIAYMEPGLVFLILFSSYFFVRYLKDKEVLSGVLCALSVLLTFYYKDPGLFLFPVFWIVLAIQHVSSERGLQVMRFLKKHSTFIYANLIALASIVPWLLLSKKYNLLQYSNIWDVRILLSLDGWAYYPSALLSHLTPVLFALFLVGVIYSVIKKDDLLTRLSIVFVFFWYVVFTSYALHPRLIIPAIAFIAIISSQTLCAVLAKALSKKAVAFVGGILAAYLLVSSMVVTYHEFENRYLPLDETYEYLADNLDAESRVYLSESIYHEFYVKKYGMKSSIVKYSTFLAELPESDLERFHSTLLDNDIDYFVFVSSADIIPMFLDFGMLKQAEQDSDRFSLEKTFTMGNNTVVLIKVVGN